MAHLPPKHRDQSLFSSNSTTPSRKRCSLNSSTRLLHRRPNTNSGSVFPYSFTSSTRREPVTREMKQRAGEILSDALPSDSSGEERREAGWLSANLRSGRGTIRTRARVEPLHDDASSTPTGLDNDSPSSSRQPRNVNCDRKCGRTSRRGPPVLLSELRGKLQEATIHLATARRRHHLTTAVDRPAQQQYGAKQRKPGSSFSTVNTYPSSRGASSRRRVQERVSRRLLLFDGAASPQESTNSGGSDSESKIQQRGTYANNRRSSFISPVHVFPSKGRSGSKDRSSIRRASSNLSAFADSSDRKLTDIQCGITYDMVDRGPNQEQEPHLHVVCRGQHQQCQEQRQKYRSLSQQRSSCDRHQQQRHYQQNPCFHSAPSFSYERDTYDKNLQKPPANRDVPEAVPRRGSTEGISRVVVDICVIRTIVHEAAALRIAWSIQNLLRRPLGNAVSLLRYHSTVFTSLDRITRPRERTKKASFGQTKQALLQARNTTAASTDATDITAATTVCTSGHEACATSSGATHEVPERFVLRSSNGRRSWFSSSSVIPVVCERAAPKAIDLHMTGTRLLVRELMELLVRPIVRLAWKKLQRLQEELRLSRHLSPLYKSLKVTSRWVTTFTRAAAAKIILRVTALAQQRWTLRALFVLQATTRITGRKQLSASCCGRESEGVSQCEESVKMQRAAVLSIEDSCCRCNIPSSFVEKYGTPPSVSTQKLCTPVAAADASCSAEIGREQALASTNHSAKAHSFGGGGPTGCRADRDKTLLITAEGTIQPRMRLHHANLQRIAVETSTSSRDLTTGIRAHSPEIGGKIYDRERLSEATEPQVSFTVSRANGVSWRQPSDKPAHRLPYPVGTPPGGPGGPMTSSSITLQSDPPQGLEENSSRQLVTWRSPPMRDSDCTRGKKETSSVALARSSPSCLIARSSPSPSVCQQTVTKSMRSVSPAIAADEAFSGPVPFTQDKRVKAAEAKSGTEH